MPRLGISPGRGRGVFAERPYHKGEVIEEAPVIVVSPSEVAHLKRTVLFDYYFLWGEASGEAAVCLGFGSIYNHSDSPNAEYLRIFEHQAIRFRALRDIAEGEEIFTNYHGRRRNDAPFRFEPSIREHEARTHS